MANELSINSDSSDEFINNQKFSDDLTDGQELSNSDQLQAITLSVSDYSSIAISSIPIGALCGAIIMIIGYTFLGIVKILKQI